jgi:hypothetical protein
MARTGAGRRDRPGYGREKRPGVGRSRLMWRVSLLEIALDIEQEVNVLWLHRIIARRQRRAAEGGG